MADVTIITVTDGLVTEIEDVTHDILLVESIITEVTTVETDTRWVSNKMVFVAGTTNNDPVSVGDKADGTRFHDGVVSSWVIRTDIPATLTARIRKTSSYPTFTDYLAFSLTADDYATGSASIPIQHLDVLRMTVDTNDVAARITIELHIQ